MWALSSMRLKAHVWYSDDLNHRFELSFQMYLEQDFYRINRTLELAPLSKGHTFNSIQE